MILDYYHFRDHTIGCAKTLYGEGTDLASQGRKRFCTTMIQSGPLEALTQLGDLTKTHRGPKRQALQALQGYIAGHPQMLEYPRYLAEGYAIGSGPTESHCKGLAARLKGRGRRWHRSAIEAIWPAVVCTPTRDNGRPTGPISQRPKTCTDTSSPWGGTPGIRLDG